MKKSILSLGAVSLAAMSFAAPAHANDSDAIINAIACAPGETLHVTTGGVEDNFGGGPDVVNPASTVLDSPHLMNYNSVHSTTNRQYDEGGNNRFFVERLTGARPGNRQATSGKVIFKVRPTGSLYDTDSLMIGALHRHGDLNGLGQPVMLRYTYGAWSTLAIPGTGWTETNNMYVGDLNILTSADGTRSMIQVLNQQNRIDFIWQEDTELDFLKVALCVQD